MPSPSIPVCIKPCRDRCYKPPYMFLIYIFSCLLDQRFENLHINCIISQFMKIRIEKTDLILQGSSLHVKQDLDRDYKMVNPSHNTIILVALFGLFCSMYLGIILLEQLTWLIYWKGPILKNRHIQSRSISMVLIFYIL